jgi:hypothetical protein
MYTCSTCKNEWPENYCPACAHTIDRSLVQQMPSSPSPLSVGLTSETITKASPSQSTKMVGRNLCPLCGSAATGKADGQFKTGGFFTGFQAFPNRCCYVCDAAWKPGCPKWAAIVCVVCGCAACPLAYLMLSGLTAKWFAVLFGALPVLYGLDVLFGNGGKMRILTIGNFDLKQSDRDQSK